MLTAVATRSTVTIIMMMAATAAVAVVMTHKSHGKRYSFWMVFCFSVF
jgi:hypothetical protein